MKIRFVLVSLAAVLALGLTPAPQEANRSDDPDIFVEAAEAELDGLFRAQANADWIAANFITYDSQKIAAAAQELVTAKVIELAKGAARFDGMDVSPRTARKLAFLKLALPVPAPDDPALIAELAAKSNALTGTYGRHRYCNEAGGCLAVRKSLL